jgi:hypothetical protein
LLRKRLKAQRKRNRGTTMQDIDFDELDRAVNSTLDPKPQADVKAVSDSFAVNVSRPEPSTPSTPPAARRSSGRFMDVVHPSSDMRSSSTLERSAPRPPEPREETPKAPEAKDTSWPDPLDFHGFKDDEPAESPAVSDSKEKELSTPLESPFLSDAKVEKRPLGAFSTNETPALEPPSQPTPPVEGKEELLLEASDEALLLAHIEAHEEPLKPEIVPEATPAPVEEEPIGPTSITQQYKEQPSTTDQPSGAIYDTEAYHQPLAHPVKKKSGALVIVWIIALILVGAGVGAGVYFFVLPLL